MNTEQKLKAKLDSLTTEGKNKNKLNERFGESNLKRLPFKSIIIETGQNPTDGKHYREIFLLNGKIQEYCDIAGYTDKPEITETDLLIVEREIFRLLDELNQFHE